MRKNVFLFLFILAFLSFGANAQEDGDGGSAFGGLGIQELSYGVKAGVASSYFASNGHKLETTGNRLGLTAGGFCEVKLTDMFGATVEVLYAQAGARALNSSYLYIPEMRTLNVGSSSLYKVNSNVSMHNLEIPVLGNMFFEMSGLEAKVFTGPSFDFTRRVMAANKVILTKSIDDSFETITFADRMKDDVTGSFHNFHMGWILGAGVSYDMFTVDASYKFGLGAVNDMGSYMFDNAFETSTDGEHPVMENLYSRVFTLTVGVKVNELIEKF